MRQSFPNPLAFRAVVKQVKFVYFSAIKIFILYENSKSIRVNSISVTGGRGTPICYCRGFYCCYLGQLNCYCSISFNASEIHKLNAYTTEIPKMTKRNHKKKIFFSFFLYLNTKNVQIIFLCNAFMQIGITKIIRVL